MGAVAAVIVCLSSSRCPGDGVGAFHFLQARAAMYVSKQLLSCSQDLTALARSSTSSRRLEAKCIHSVWGYSRDGCLHCDVDRVFARSLKLWIALYTLCPTSKCSYAWRGEISGLRFGGTPCKLNPSCYTGLHTALYVQHKVACRRRARACTVT